MPSSRFGHHCFINKHLLNVLQFPFSSFLFSGNSLFRREYRLENRPLQQSDRSGFQLSEARRKCLQAESALGPPQAPRYNSSHLLHRLMRAQCPRSPVGEFNLFVEIRFPSLLAAWALITTWCSGLQLPSLGSIMFQSLRGAAQPDLVRARWVRQLPGYHAAVGWEHCLFPNWLYQPQRTPFSCTDVCKCNSIKPFT